MNQEQCISSPVLCTVLSCFLFTGCVSVLCKQCFFFRFSSGLLHRSSIISMITTIIIIIFLCFYFLWSLCSVFVTMTTRQLDENPAQPMCILFFTVYFFLISDMTIDEYSSSKCVLICFNSSHLLPFDWNKWIHLLPARLSTTRAVLKSPVDRQVFTPPIHPSFFAEPNDYFFIFNDEKFCHA